MDLRVGNIGFFDSGIGGISVLKSTIKILENESFVYYGDSKNAPYGSKTKQEIINLCINICNFLIYENNCKIIVIACNTASSAAINYLREKYEPMIPIIGIEPAIKPAIIFRKNSEYKGYILVLGTPFTIRGEKLNNLIKYYNEDLIECISLEFLADMIERNVYWKEIYDYLYINLKKYIGKVNSVVLGCTHYFFVKDIINKILGENIGIFDGCEGTSMELKRRLIENSMINLNNNFKVNKRIYIYNSLNYDKVIRSKVLLGRDL